MAFDQLAPHIARSSAAITIIIIIIIIFIIVIIIIALDIGLATSHYINQWYFVTNVSLEKGH